MARYKNITTGMVVERDDTDLDRLAIWKRLADEQDPDEIPTVRLDASTEVREPAVLSDEEAAVDTAEPRTEQDPEPAVLSDEEAAEPKDEQDPDEIPTVEAPARKPRARKTAE